MRAANQIPESLPSPARHSLCAAHGSETRDWLNKVTVRIGGATHVTDPDRSAYTLCGRRWWFECNIGTGYYCETCQIALSRIYPPNARGEWRRAKSAKMQTETRDRRPLHCACWAVSFHPPNFNGNKGKHAATTTAETTAVIANAIVPAKMNAARTVTSRRKLRTEEYIIQGSGTKRSQMGDCKTSRVRPGNESTPRNAYHPTANSAITQQEMQRTPTAAVRSQRNALMMTPNAPHQL